MTMAKALTVQDFFKRFPDDSACLEHLFQVRFGSEASCPKCGEVGKLRRLSKLPAYTCNCGHHIHPMQGTPFERSHTALQKWFYAIYLFTTSRHGVPAKELQRQLGVTYKTAWRMGHEIRKYMARIDGDTPLDGHVEVDETYVGGKSSGRNKGRSLVSKSVVFGMMERGGDIMTKVVANAQRGTLERHILENIRTGATISSDEYVAYRFLTKRGYRHGTVRHNIEQWVDGIHHVNGLEGFWAQIKRSIQGTHIHVSRKHLAKYLGEFEFRYNMRKAPEFMIARLLLSF
jgi:transposase-like protein/predicted RNA-binding Zn-ribbon protein involved in translation (DUF1610 family)